MKQDNAFTGLEAAIVLIAFVVVAAVFSYVMLGAGFFATQKAQEVTYAGIQQTTSNMYLVGQIYGVMDESDPSNPQLTVLSFKIGVPEGGQPQDVKDLRLLFSKNDGLPTALTNEDAATVTDLNLLTESWACGTDPCWIFKDVKEGDWSYIDATNPADPVAAIVSGVTGTPSDSKISPGGKIDIRVILGASSGITNGSSFDLEIKPRIGASYLVAKTLSVGFTNGPLY